MSEVGTAEVGTREVGLGEVRDCLTCPAPLIPFADSLFSTLEKLESLVAVHGGDPYNEFFKTFESLVAVHGDDPTMSSSRPAEHW